MKNIFFSSRFTALRIYSKLLFISEDKENNIKIIDSGLGSFPVLVYVVQYKGPFFLIDLFPIVIFFWHFLRAKYNLCINFAQ